MALASSITVKRIGLILLILSTLAATSSAQYFGDDLEEVVLPDAVMEQVTKGVLKAYFKPDRPRDVFLSSDGLKAHWLPKIANIEFELVDESTQTFRGGFLFHPVNQDKKERYYIAFGYGSLGCGDVHGDEWSFQVSKVGKVLSLKRVPNSEWDLPVLLRRHLRVRSGHNSERNVKGFATSWCC
ncbi:MAG: hypothetical protein ABL984_19165 [Pyrinomonadaceae bacterium]